MAERSSSQRWTELQHVRKHQAQRLSMRTNCTRSCCCSSANLTSVEAGSGRIRGDATQTVVSRCSFTAAQMFELQRLSGWETRNTALRTADCNSLSAPSTRESIVPSKLRSEWMRAGESSLRVRLQAHDVDHFELLNQLFEADIADGRSERMLVSACSAMILSTKSEQFK